MGVSSRGMGYVDLFLCVPFVFFLHRVLDSFVTEMFGRVASEGCSLVQAGKHHTMGIKELAAACRFAFPGELGRHAAIEGAKAVGKYTGSA